MTKKKAPDKTKLLLSQCDSLSTHLSCIQKWAREGNWDYIQCDVDGDTLQSLAASIQELVWSITGEMTEKVCAEHSIPTDDLPYDVAVPLALEILRLRGDAK